MKKDNRGIVIMICNIVIMVCNYIINLFQNQSDNVAMICDKIVTMVG